MAELKGNANEPSRKKRRQWQSEIDIIEIIKIIAEWKKSVIKKQKIIRLA